MKRIVTVCLLATGFAVAAHAARPSNNVRVRYTSTHDRTPKMRTRIVSPHK